MYSTRITVRLTESHTKLKNKANKKYAFIVSG